MNNQDIIDAWIASKSAFRKSKALSTDGVHLFSYSLPIGYTNKQGKKVVWDYTATGGNYRSQTTSTHVGLAKTKAELIRNTTIDDEAAPIEIPVSAYDPKTFTK